MIHINGIPRILLVDDTPQIIDLLLELLSDYKCLVAPNGEIALKAAHSVNKPDLIVLDVNMPGLDGYEVIQKLKSDDSTKDIPVIFLTAKSSVEDEIRGFELGAVDYITKPISPPVVLARIKNHLDLKIAREMLEIQNGELIKAFELKENVENITRHDLKSPLSVIVLNAQMLLEVGELSEVSRGIIKLIEKAGFRILDMIDRSLDLFKMEQGIYNFKIEQVNLLDLISKIAEETSLLFVDKAIKLNILLNGMPLSDGQSFLIPGEFLLLYTMFGNLVKNAFEASPHGEQIIINLWTDEYYYQITIHNQGAVPREIRDKFFDKYVTYGKKNGTGLGTYSAKLIAESMNGSIYMNTSEDTGTTIMIKFVRG